MIEGAFTRLLNFDTDKPYKEIKEIRNDLFEEFHQVQKGPLMGVLVDILMKRIKNNDWYAVDRITDFTTHMFNSLYEGEDSFEDMVEVFDRAIWDSSTPV